MNGGYVVSSPNNGLIMLVLSALPGCITHRNIMKLSSRTIFLPQKQCGDCVITLGAVFRQFEPLFFFIRIVIAWEKSMVDVLAIRLDLDVQFIRQHLDTAHNEHELEALNMMMEQGRSPSTNDLNGQWNPSRSPSETAGKFL